MGNLKNSYWFNNGEIFLFSIRLKQLLTIYKFLMLGIKYDTNTAN